MALTIVPAAMSGTLPLAIADLYTPLIHQICRGMDPNSLCYPIRGVMASTEISGAVAAPVLWRLCALYFPANTHPDGGHDNAWYRAAVATDDVC